MEEGFPSGGNRRSALIVNDALLLQARPFRVVPKIIRLGRTLPDRVGSACSDGSRRLAGEDTLASERDPFGATLLATLLRAALAPARHLVVLRDVEGNGVGSVGDAQLLVDVLEVEFDRLDRDLESLGQLSIAVPVAQGGQ